MNQSPGSSPYKLADLVPIVREALQGNTSFSDNTACGWLQRSIWNITDNYPFEELRVTGPNVTLPANATQLVIPVASYLRQGDDVTLMEDPVIYLDASQTIGYPMDYMTPKAIEPLLHVPGAIPFKYTRFGNNFLFGGLPNTPYVTFLRYQIRHPFSDVNLQASPCMFPTAWNEVMAYDAARRGAVTLRWWDIGDKLRQILYGDPMNQEGNPGMIKELIAQSHKDERNSSRQLTIRVGRY
jgi:hypothetical protein